MTVKRLLHLGLLLLALTGLASQSIAHATTFQRLAGPMQMSSESTACGGAAGRADSGNFPCKQVGLQCLATMGCPAMTITRPDPVPYQCAAIEAVKSVPALVDALHGRSCVPELEPPTLLI